MVCKLHGQHNSIQHASCHKCVASIRRGRDSSTALPEAAGGFSDAEGATTNASMETRTNGADGTGYPEIANVPSREAMRVIDGGRGDLNSDLGQGGGEEVRGAAAMGKD